MRTGNITIYTVLLENGVGSLNINATDEGLIVDLYDEGGELVTTWARTAQEFAEELEGEL